MNLMIVMGHIMKLQELEDHLVSGSFTHDFINLKNIILCNYLPIIINNFTIQTIQISVLIKFSLAI